MDISAPLQAAAALLPTTGGGNFVPLTVTSSATPVFNSNSNAAFTYALNQNVTSSTFLTVPKSGQTTVFQFNICQNNVGGFTMTWPSNVTLPPNYAFNIGANTCSPVSFVYSPFTNLWTPWQTLTSNTNPPLPFSTIPFTATPVFSGLSNAAYGITLTGNVTASTISGTPVNGNIMKLHICQGAGAPWTFAFPSSFLNTSTIQPSGCTDETYSYDGVANWSQLTQPASGGGGNPASPTNSVQKNASGIFSPTNCLEPPGTPSTYTCQDDPHFSGPNLGVDVTISPYNGRVVNPNAIPSTTGTITSGTNSLTVASNPGFQQFDGIVGLGIGGTNCGTPPLAPTAFAGLASSSTGTGWMVAGGTGSTSVSYAISAVSKLNCYTAASPVVTVSNSNNSMGAIQLSITSCAIAAASNVITCTVGSTTGLVNGFWGLIDGTSDNSEFGGYHHFTVVDGTHISFAGNMNSLYFMSSTSSTGGTLYYKAGNHLIFPSLPTGTGMKFWAVYRCIGASCALPANAANYSLVYVSYPADLGYTDTTYNTWDDFGTTMTQTIGYLIAHNAAWFIPANPPSTNINDSLITQITGISGLNFTLLNNAINTTGATSCNGAPCPVQFGNDYAIKTAQAFVPKTVTGGGGSVHFPPPVENPATGAFCYVTSSYLELTGFVMNLGGVLCPTVTLNIGTTNLNGTNEDSARMVFGQFSQQSELDFRCVGANPCITKTAGSSIKNLTIESFGPGMTLVFESTNGGSPTVVDDVNFQSGGGANDYMSILWYTYGSSQSGFGGTFNTDSFSMGPTQVVGATDTPAFISKNNQLFHFNDIFGNRRGFYFECNQPAINACAFYESMKMGKEWQGPITPLVTLNSAVAGNIKGIVYLEHLFQDSAEMPLFVEANAIGTIGAPIYINQSNIPGGSMPLVSGDLFQGGISVSTTEPLSSHQIGTNHDVIQCTGQENVGNNQGYTGCGLPALNLATVYSTGNLTLSGSMGNVVATASGTITVPHALAGQLWFVFSQSGTTTLTIDSGTLFNNGTPGSFVIPNGFGVFVIADGINARAAGNGGSGGGIGTGTQNCLTDWATTSTLGSICSSIAGQVPVANNGSAPTFLSPSMVDSPNSPVVTTPYTIACDTVSTIIDRTKTIRFQTGAAAITIPLSSASGCSGLVTTAFNDGAGTLTFTRSGSDTLTVVTGSAALDAQTSFTLVSGQYATISQNATGLWLIRVSIGASAGVSSFTGDGALLSNSLSVGAVVASLAAAAANKVWANCTTGSATPNYCSLTIAMLPTGIPNANLANPATTVNTQTCTLGSTCTISYPNIPAGAIANTSTATTQALGDSSTDIATDQFVANANAAVNPAVAVLAATTGSNLTGTYSNGTAGIGATFTVTATGAFTLDGVAINTIGQRVLLKDQTSAFQNGVYTATIIGSTGISPIFTRALDYDQPSDINSTGAIPVQSGTVNASTSWLLTSTVNTVGTDALTYVQFSLAPSNIATKVANGTAAMGTSAITSGSCATVVTVSATGVATTDVITVGFNTDPTAITGYGASATGLVLTIYPYPTANNVNFKVCNSTASSITPSALTLNWKVVR
jgi:hypothetical protein